MTDPIITDLARHAAPSSKVFVFHAADNYSAPGRLRVHDARN